MSALSCFYELPISQFTCNHMSINFWSRLKSNWALGIPIFLLSFFSPTIIVGFYPRPSLSLAMFYLILSNIVA